MAALLERITRVELGVVVVSRPDGVRTAARDRARTAAIAAGRGALLEEAIAATREVTMRAFASAAFSGTWAATDMAASVATASDRVAAATAFEEAATAAVVEDLVDEDTLEVLRATTDELIRSTGLPSPGSLSAFTAPAAVAASGPLQVVVVAGFVLVCAVIGLVLDLGLGLLMLAVGVVLIAGIARRRRRPPIS